MARRLKARRLANRIRQAKRQVTDFLDLPPEAVLDLPRLTLIGNSRLIVENHRGLIAYEKDLVQVSVTLGEIKINGEDLKLRVVRPEAITVEGIIKRISLG
ncbi:MAG: sporulation protein YqfC [Moorellaceae bacterium]